MNQLSSSGSVGRITELASDPGDGDEERLRKSLLLGACFVFIPVVFPWIAVYFAFGERLAAAISLFYFVASSLLVAFFLYTRRFNFLCDVWGDTVNTASRMESHGVAGKIQITRATYELIKDEFACEPRGVVSVKGTGELETWFLVGRK